MAQHLFKPDSSDPWHGRFAGFALRQKSLAWHLFDVVTFSFPSASGDDHHIWVHDIAFSTRWTWAFCPVLIDFPGVGPTLHLRALSRPTKFEPHFLEWMAQRRREFGASLAHQLMLPVLVSDELDHWEHSCRRTLPGAIVYPTVEVVPTRAVSREFAIVIAAMFSELSDEQARDYALALKVHSDLGGDPRSAPEPPHGV